ncbi:MAG: alanine/ornithine racemase family PLP-dependent enzyme [Candidatus Thermoplasmatota archaeon]|nr:alanine/ornithine racemase family PLP-dependent enzyme [Candidatus Thermoplasmatota archaeon]
MVIDLDKIEHNARTIVNLADKIGIEITGVTKATCGDFKVARAILAGGAVSIADSRIENIQNLEKSGVKTDFMLLRTPMLSEIKSVVEHVDVSLNSELEVISRLSDEAMKKNNTHQIVLMVEMGDLREGVNRNKVADAIEEILGFDGVELYGIGMNLACFGGVVPTDEKINKFDKLVNDIENKFKISFKMVSGGNSANIPLLFKNPRKSRISNLRIGEGILLGLETVNRTPIPNTYQDAFVLESEIIELKEKPSLPDGEISQNAFGETPVFEDRGIITRGIVAIGKQDVIVKDLTPIDPNISILGSSSDHILLHIKNPKYVVGDVVQFSMKYGALVHLFTSKYVKKVYVGRSFS